MNNPGSSEGLPLGALEFGGVGPDTTVYRVLHELVETVPRLEEWGYARLWVAEHHRPHFAWSVPELMLPVLAGVSEHIHVGTACILLNLHSPFRVAESFRLLEALFPGRIDLGVGRGMAADQVTRALGVEPPIPKGTFEVRLEELLVFLGDDGFAQGHPNRGLAAAPRGVSPPPPWVMTGSDDGARLAGRQGCSLCCPLFLRSFRGDPSLVRTYRENFQPTPGGLKPRVVMAVAGICTEDNQKAAERRAAFTAHPDPVIMEGMVDSPDKWGPWLVELRETWDLDEVVVLNLGTSHRSRLETYRNLAQVARTLPASGRPRRGGSSTASPIRS